MDTLKQPNKADQSTLLKESLSKRMDPIKAGITLGILLGGWHLAWVLLVALGWAQPVINFIMSIHFINITFIIQQFNFGTAAMLVGINTIAGFAFGSLFALLWNRMLL